MMLLLHIAEAIAALVLIVWAISYITRQIIILVASAKKIRDDPTIMYSDYRQEQFFTDLLDKTEKHPALSLLLLPADKVDDLREWLFHRR